MQTISNDPPPTGTRCDICGRQLIPPWVLVVQKRAGDSIDAS